MRHFPAALVLFPIAFVQAARAQAVGLNVILNQPPTAQTLAALEAHGNVRGLIYDINAVMLQAQASQLDTIRSLPFVASASQDVQCATASAGPLPITDLSAGASYWALDAINVTDAGGSRTVAYDGDGVYVAVIDTGLPHNWRSYFPEPRIATQLARGFGGGGGQAHVVSSQPSGWENDTVGHGTSLTSVILGFAYWEGLPLPVYFNGVAPKATVIPISVGFTEHNFVSGHWESAVSHAIVYATNLKVSGQLGGARLIINLSSGLHQPLPLERVAINYAIANDVIVVVCAGNEAAAGMRYPAAYPEVISVGATAWTGILPPTDPTQVLWIMNDVAEGNLAQHVMAPFSSHALPGQFLDVVAPGFPIPVPLTLNGTIDYTFEGGTSQATPFVVGIVALMLQKNPTLTQQQVESILTSAAVPMGAGSATLSMPIVGPGNRPTFDDHANVSLAPSTFSWPVTATGAGFIQADLALAATPLP